MIIVKTAKDLSDYLDLQRKTGLSTGFVPTMGALHEGHVSLVRMCKEQNDIAICSIFINPAQFNDKNDFDKYPVTIEKDISMLVDGGCDVLFMPSVKEMYPDGVRQKKYELGYLETILEGKFRPGHFQGVCLVVEQLLLMTKPDMLYLGRKDYQQCLVITKLVEIMGLNEKLKIVFAPTLRESDGLAMSSRNMRLSKEQRATAPTIYGVLCFIKEQAGKKSIDQLKSAGWTQLEEKGFKPDYIEVADGKTLEPLSQWEENAVVLIAAFLGEIRLIDNMSTGPGVFN